QQSIDPRQFAAKHHANPLDRLLKQRGMPLLNRRAQIISRAAKRPDKETAGFGYRDLAGTVQELINNLLEIAHIVAQILPSNIIGVHVLTDEEALLYSIDDRVGIIQLLEAVMQVFVPAEDA